MANWPLIAIRIAESFLFIVMIIISIVAAIVPVAVSAGLGSFDFRNLTDPADVVTSLVADHWMLIIYVLAVITLVLLLLVALHSFVEAANARVYVDAERNAVALGAILPRVCIENLKFIATSGDCIASDSPEGKWPSGI